MPIANPFHAEILGLIKKNSGKPTRHTFLNSYLGNDHPRYPINNPTLKTIARTWMRSHRDMDLTAFVQLLTSLVEGESCTEKMMAGILMGYAPKPLLNFPAAMFDQWLDHLVGWVEVDTLCTGSFIRTHLPARWPEWKKLLVKLSKDANINKRRASLVLLCSPIASIADHEMVDVAFQNITRLKGEKEVLITKAISWLLRSMINHYRDRVSAFLDENEDSLPKIALRETRAKLITGRKTKAPTGRTKRSSSLRSTRA